MATPNVTIDSATARTLCAQALRAAGANDEQAASTSAALVAAEGDGQKGHGLTRITTYTEQLRTGKVDGTATPTVTTARPGVAIVDAAHGFAYPAIDAALRALPGMASENGIALGVIRRSHHFGQAGAHVERLAKAGCLGLLFGNSPKAMAFWGGANPMMGTNPIAFAAPLENDPPLVIDLALSVAARGKVVAANKTGEPIPEGWALDGAGAPTTDPAAALGGSMVPLGGAKGAALAMMVEVFAAALVGAHFGWEAASFLDGAGEAPNVGQVLIAIDTGAVSQHSYTERMSVLLNAIAEEDGARLPGLTRLEKRAQSARDGLSLSPSLYDDLQRLAAA